MDSMTLSFLAVAITLCISILVGFISRTDKDSLTLFLLFAITVFCFGVNSTALLFKIFIG